MNTVKWLKGIFAEVGKDNLFDIFNLELLMP